MQQHDNSTLFSLRSLTQQGASPREEAASDRNESGLIDLAALAAMHDQRAERPKLDVAPFVPVGLFDVPEKAPDPAPTPPVEQPAAGMPRWKVIALLAGAVTVVAAASAVAIFATHGAGDPGLAPVAALQAATAPASPPSEAPRTEAPAPAEVKPAVVPATPAPASSHAPSRRGLPRPTSTAVVKTDPVKPAPPCDLMCQMQKSVNHPR